MRLFILFLAFVSCLTAQATSNEVQRSLDAVDDCYAATTALVDPSIGNGGLMDFPNFLFVNVLICNSTAKNCDYADSDYVANTVTDCADLEGKILTRDVKFCQTDLGRSTGIPAASDVDYINIPFCMATTCPDDVDIVDLHKLLYAEAEASGNNPYAGYVDTMAGACLVEQTDAPVTAAPTSSPESGAGKGKKLEMSLLLVSGAFLSFF